MFELAHSAYCRIDHSLVLGADLKCAILQRHIVTVAQICVFYL